MTLDDATAALLAQLRNTRTRPVWESTPAQARQRGPALAKAYGRGPEMASARDVSLDSDVGGHFRVRILTPTRDPVSIIVYFHGGGWVTGSIDEFDTMARKLAAQSRAAVVLVDYRKAPEHRYPFAIEDAWASVCWVHRHRAVIAGEHVPLAVAGDSAGGNLAAVVAQRARDRGLATVDVQILIYPVTDADFTTESYTEPDNQLLVPRRSMEWFWDQYVPDRQKRDDPDVAPLHARSLEGLPPAIVVTAEYDVLRDEGEAYARRLISAGVEVHHRRFAGQTHGFFTLVNILPGSDAGIAFVAQAMNRILTKGQNS